VYVRTGIKNINGQRSQPLLRLHYPDKLTLQKHNEVIHADVGINLRCKALQWRIMKIRCNYIFFFLIFLSLFGFGSGQFISGTNIKYLKETEWVSKPNSKSKVSKCFHFHLLSFVVSSKLALHSLEKGYRNLYDRKMKVQLLLQTRLFRNINIKHLISTKLYIPGLSTDDHNVTYQRIVAIKHCCSAHVLTHQVRNFMWNHLPDRKWINQKIELNAKGRGVLNGYLIGFL